MLTIENVDRALGRPVYSVNGEVYMLVEINKLADSYVFHLHSGIVLGTVIKHRISLSRERKSPFGYYILQPMDSVFVNGGQLWPIEDNNLQSSDLFLKELQLILHNIS